MNPKEDTTDIEVKPIMPVIKKATKETYEQLQNRFKELSHLERNNIVTNPQNWNKILDESGIPKRYRPYTLKTFQNIKDENIEKSVKICTEYVENFKTYQKEGKGILLMGSPGRGKTTLACAVGMEILKQDTNKIYFVSMAKIYDVNLQSIDKKDLVIIDDLGVEYTDNANIMKKLAQIMIILNDNKTPIIITTNLKVGDLITQYPPKISDRINQMTAKKILMNGKSIRPQNN